MKNQIFQSPYRLGRVLTWTVVVAASIHGADTFAQGPGRLQRKEDPEVGRLVDIGGRSIYMTVHGEGEPTVIFESGKGDSSDTWHKVVPEIAKLDLAP